MSGLPTEGLAAGLIAGRLINSRSGIFTVVEAVGGRVSAEPRVVVGSTFVVDIPGLTHPRYEVTVRRVPADYTLDATIQQQPAEGKLT